MSHTNEHTEVTVYARIAGAAYLATIVLGIFSVNVIAARLVVPGDSAATINNIMTHSGLYRIGIAGEIVMYALVILLAHALYVVLKPINPNMALLALWWRMAEAIVGSALTVVSGILPLLLVESGTTLVPNQPYTLVDALLALRSNGLDVVLIFIGLGGTLFCYLFWKSRFIPRLLAAWAMVTYLTMLMLSFISLLTPIDESTKLLFYAPGGLFEILLGIWLLVKGVAVNNQGRITG